MKGLTRLDSYRGTEEQWAALLTTSTVDTLFCTPQWQRTWWEQFGGDAEMLLLCLKDDGGIQGIAPLSRRNGTISFIGGRDVSDYSDFLVSRGTEHCFYSSLVDHLDGEQWDKLELSSMPTHSPTLVYLPELAQSPGVPGGRLGRRRGSGDYTCPKTGSTTSSPFPRRTATS